ncbi:hypothetical protein [Azospirillum melinis]
MAHVALHGALKRELGGEPASAGSFSIVGLRANSGGDSGG